MSKYAQFGIVWVVGVLGLAGTLWWAFGYRESFWGYLLAVGGGSLVMVAAVARLQLVDPDVYRSWREEGLLDDAHIYRGTVLCLYDEPSL